MTLTTTLTAYFRPRLLAVMALGFVSGLPLALCFSTLSYWLAEEGISKTAIGLFALAGTPYAVKFAWAPLIDRLPLPFLTKALGLRRGWMLVTQFCLIAAIIGVAVSDPHAQLYQMAFFALLIAIFSATQDIIIDAYRIEILPEEEQGMGAASVVFGWRIGAYLSGGFAILLSAYMDWGIVYAFLACLLPVGFIIMLWVGEPKRHEALVKTDPAHWFIEAVIDPFREFMRREGWWLLLVFIILYKLGDAYAGVMTNPFLVDMGFSKQEVFAIVKTWGLGATLVGAFLGGAVVHRYNMMKALLLCGVAQMLSNLMFVWQSVVGNDPWLLVVTISVENLAGGMGTAAFVAFISNLCNRRFTATQYALFSALASTGRTWLSASSGFVVDTLDWTSFFLISTAIALPGLLMLSNVKGHYENAKRS